MECIKSEILDDFQELSSEREKQKMRGINDYSLIGSMLKVSDEERLHTRFIFSLLDPRGKHYQGTLFIGLFLEVAGLSGFLDLNNVRVYKEYSAEDLKGRIDLLLTDGDKWVAVENKINALDGEKQIFRYVDYLEKNADSPDSVCMIYLTKYGSVPEGYSLGEYHLDERSEYIVQKSGKESVSKYVNMTYQDGIKKWLLMCKSEVGNIKNLSNAISEYEFVRKKVCKEYRSKIMSIEKILVDSEGEMIVDKYQAMLQLSKDFSLLRAQWVEEVMENGVREVLGKMDDEFVPMDEKTCATLKNRVYRRGDAKSFFTAGDEAKNKGVFFAFERRGAHYAVAVLFGSQLLHAGIVPLNAWGDDEKRFYDFDSKRSICFAGDAGTKCGVEVKKHPAINNVFPGLVSHAKNLREEGALELRNFSGSDFACVIRGLVDISLGADDATVG